MARQFGNVEWVVGFVAVGVWAGEVRADAAAFAVAENDECEMLCRGELLAEVDELAERVGVPGVGFVVGLARDLGESGAAGDADPIAVLQLEETSVVEVFAKYLVVLGMAGCAIDEQEDLSGLPRAGQVAEGAQMRKDVSFGATVDAAVDKDRPGDGFCGLRVAVGPGALGGKGRRGKGDGGGQGELHR